MIRLSDVKKMGWTLVRDGNFQSLGLCSAHPGIPLLTFCGSRKYLAAALKNPDVSCILCSPELLDDAQLQASEKGLCAVPDLKVAFFSLHNELGRGSFAEAYLGKSSPTWIAPDAKISPQAVIEPENVKIGRNVVIEPFVMVKSGTEIGDDCIIRAGTILGGEGLEFIRGGEHGLLPVDHRGKLILGQRVEIQQNCNISRSLFPWDCTRIGDDCKIESLVHIAHGVKMGKRCLAAACACVAGSAVLDDDIWIGPNAVVSSEVHVGNGARVSLGAVAAANVPAGETVTGNFAIPHDQFLKDLMDKML